MKFFALWLVALVAKDIPLPDLLGDNGHEPKEDPEPEVWEEKPQVTEGRQEVVPPVLAPSGMGQSGQFLDDYNALAELFHDGPGEKSIDLRTDINEAQVIQFARGRAIAAHYGITALSDFINDIARLSVSKNRKSRKEFVSAFQSANMSDAAEAAGVTAGIMGKLRS